MLLVWYLKNRLFFSGVWSLILVEQPTVLLKRQSNTASEACIAQQEFHSMRPSAMHASFLLPITIHEKPIWYATHQYATLRIFQPKKRPSLRLLVRIPAIRVGVWPITAVVRTRRIIPLQFFPLPRTSPLP